MTLTTSLHGIILNLIVVCRSVHSVCLWDEKGANKVHQALHEDILDFIKQAQAVSETTRVLLNIFLLCFCLLFIFLPSFVVNTLVRHLALCLSLS